MLSFIGAFIATYFLSRALLYLIGRSLPRGVTSLLAVHVLSFAVLALSVGLLKAYATAFAFDQTMVFVAPQLIWLAFDLARGAAIPFVPKS